MKYLIGALIIIVLGAGIWFGFARKPSPASETRSDNSSAAMPKETITPTPSTTPAEQPQKTSQIAVLQTNFGNIEITLDAAAAPQTVANFEKLIRDGFYNKLTFHRIVPSFVIQGGDPKGDGTGGPGYTIPAEIKLPHKRGSVATARTGGKMPDGTVINPTKASSGSQFYIVLDDKVGPAGLDGEYTVFGQVTAGMDSVDKIARVKTGAGDKPLEPVIINKAYIK